MTINLLSQNSRKRWQRLAVPVLALVMALVATTAFAATSIGTSISTAGSVTSTQTGAATIIASGAPAASAVLSLVQLGPVIAGGSANGTYIGINPATFTGNFVDFQVGGTSKFKVTNAGVITLANAETIDNSTDGTIDLAAANLKFTGNFTGKNINIVPASIGTAGVKFFTAGTSTAILDVGAQTDRVYGFGTHLTTNFAGADTWVKGLDSRIVVTGGTQGNVQSAYASVTKSGGVAAAQELWGGSFASTITGGTAMNMYGTVGTVSVGAAGTVGPDGGDPNFIVGVLGSTYVDTSATLADDMIDAAIIGQIEQSSNNRAKADAAIAAILQGDNGTTVNVGAAFKVIDNRQSFGNYDYGLDMGSGAGGPIGGMAGISGNTFAQADIRLMNDETIDNKTDGTINLGAANLKFTGNFTGKNINIVPAAIGTTGVKFFTAGTSTAILDVGAQTDRVYGFGTHLTTNFAGADTFVKGVDARIVVTGGTQGTVQGIYSGVTKSGGVATAQELWGASTGVTVTGGTIANAYGSVGQINIGTGVTSGADGGDPNFVTGVLATSYVDTGATLANDIIDAALIAQIEKSTNARKKATAAVVALLQGDGASNTAGAAFKVIDQSSTAGYNFDYGLDFGAGPGGPIGGQLTNGGNTFQQADIRLQNDEIISNATNGTISFGAANITTTGSANFSGASSVIIQSGVGLADAACTGVPGRIYLATTTAGNMTVDKVYVCNTAGSAWLLMN
ncbi:MAG: hypothetical protein HY974_04475 [Candidatus Kerfeldbacteria bacterium]|nr:hypothetical protein [Candidatus Kerfeldbacteria bacterium]